MYKQGLSNNYEVLIYDVFVRDGMTGWWNFIRWVIFIIKIIIETRCQLFRLDSTTSKFRSLTIWCITTNPIETISTRDSKKFERKWPKKYRRFKIRSYSKPFSLEYLAKTCRTRKHHTNYLINSTANDIVSGRLDQESAIFQLRLLILQGGEILS